MCAGRCVGIARLVVETQATQWSDTDEREMCRANLLRECVATALSFASAASPREGLRSSLDTLSEPDTLTGPERDSWVERNGVYGGVMESRSMTTRPNRTILSACKGDYQRATGDYLDALVANNER